MKFRTFYLWFALPVALIVLWMAAIYFPLSTKVRARDMELSNLDREAETTDNQIRAVLEAKKRNEQLKISVRELESRIPILDRFPEFMREVVRTAKKDGLVITGMKGGLGLNDKGRSQLLNPSVELSTLGGFKQMGKFLEELEQSEAYSRVSRANISYDMKEYPALKGTFTMQFKVLRGTSESK
jgi:hypothetical protein